MTPQIILRQLWVAGIRLRLTNDELNLSVPAGCLLPEQRALVIAHKPALVAFLREVQVTSKDLIEAAMKVCDVHGDAEAARAEMQCECLAIPEHLQTDLLEHFRAVSQTTYIQKGKIHE